MAVLSAPDKVGYPPTMHSDASPGLSCAGRHSAAITSSSRDSKSCALVRLVGTASRAHPGCRRELAQGAQAGYQPCCTSATHVALLPSCALGRNNVEKRGRSPMEKIWALAPRRLALCGNLWFPSQGCDWVADTLTMDVPDPLIRAPPCMRKARTCMPRIPNPSPPLPFVERQPDSPTFVVIPRCTP